MKHLQLTAIQWMLIRTITFCNLNKPYWREWNTSSLLVERWVTSCDGEMLDIFLMPLERIHWLAAQTDDHVQEEYHTKSLVHQNASNWYCTNPCPQCAKQMLFSTCQNTGMPYLHHLYWYHNLHSHNLKLFPDDWCSKPANTQYSICYICNTITL